LNVPGAGARTRIVLASANRNKQREFRAFFSSISGLAGRDVKLVLPGELSACPGEDEVLESGRTYEENALIKARAWARSAGIPAIADDSGLEVRHLGWAPGIRSARAAEGSDADRIDWLLSGLDGVTDRRACFVACIVIAFPSDGGSGRYYFASEGRCWGSITHEPSGESGFGYDPVFVPDGCDATFGDLGPDVKSKISHRAAAMAGVAQMMGSVLKYHALNGIWEV
jgi:XTP/dITP diphosphohydrolase